MALVVNWAKLEESGLDIEACDLAVTALLRHREAIGPEGATFETIARMVQAGALTITNQDKTDTQGQEN